MDTFANILVSAVVIGVAAWISRRYPVTAGFVIAPPLATMLVLPTPRDHARARMIQSAAPPWTSMVSPVK